MEHNTVESWKSRIGQSPDYELYRPSHVEAAMLDEISDLRTLLRATQQKVLELQPSSEAQS
jgi:hypothetical protein